MRGFHSPAKSPAGARGFQPANARAKTQLFANGGLVRGPGTGTSDDIQTEVPAGTYIMPTDSTQAISEQVLEKAGAQVARGFSPGGNRKVPVNLSNGEFKLPPEQVHAIGVQVLNQMKGATHTPVPARGFAPYSRKEHGGEPRMFFANGGLVTDEKEPRGFAPQAEPALAPAPQAREPEPPPQQAVEPSRAFGGPESSPSSVVNAPGAYRNAPGEYSDNRTGFGFKPENNRLEFQEVTTEQLDQQEPQARAARGFAPEGRSPVGMTVEAAQKAGLVGPRIGYNPAYDQRVEPAQPAYNPDDSSSSQWMKDLRDPRNLAVRNASVSSKIFRDKGEEMMANKTRNAKVAATQDMIGKGMAAAQEADTARLQSDNSLAASLAQTRAGTANTMMEQQGANRRSLVQAAIEASKDRREASRQGARDRLDAQRLQIDAAKAAREGLPSGYRYRQDGGMEAIPGGPADVRASKEAQQQTRDSSDVLDILGQARPLVKESTESYLGNAVDQAARVIGVSTPGAEAGAQLKTLEGQLVSKMPKMSGPQSDKDVLLYKQMAGQIGDTSIPAKQRLAAMQTIESLHSKYASPQAQQGQQAQQRTVTRTGTLNGRSVVQYSDGTVSYTN